MKKNTVYIYTISDTFIFADCSSEYTCCCWGCSADRVNSRLYFLLSLTPPDLFVVDIVVSSQSQTPDEAAVDSSKVRPQETRAIG